MAYRKTTRRKFQYSQVVPLWTSTETNAVTMAFQALMSKFGISDFSTYIKQWRVQISLSVIVCAVLGAANYGITGFVLGGLAGLLAPAALLYLAVLLVGIAIVMGLYVLAWAAIWAIFKWCVVEFFRF